MSRNIIVNQIIFSGNLIINYYSFIEITTKFKATNNFD